MLGGNNMGKTSREKEILKLIKECKEDSERMGEPLERRAIEIMGKKEVLDVYRLSISALYYNIRNGRFAAELQEKEAELGWKLDTNDADDAGIIRKILLSQKKSETEILKKDIKAKGQIDPGLITYDGQVINGNRRMAILEELFSETSNPKFEFLEVQVLPKSVDEKGLWRIEAGLQLSRDKRLDYSPINQLLKIDEGIGAGLTPTQIASTYYGKVTKSTIEKDHARLKLIQEYLQYIGKPFQYKYFTEGKGKDNHFINLQNQIEKLRKQGLNEGEITNAILLGYEIIHAGKKHMDVRSLAEIYLSKKAKAYAEKPLNEPSEGTDEDTATTFEESDSDSTEDEDEDVPEETDDEDEETEAEPAATDSLEEVTKKSRSKKIADAYDDAMEIVKYEKDREKPKVLINRAYNALDSIDLSGKHFRMPEVKTALQELAKKVNEIIQLIDKQPDE